VSTNTGALAQRLSYRPFGEPLEVATDHPESRGYTGQRRDPETGLFYLHARYYDAALSRFIGPDQVVPSFANLGLNAYTYAIDDPVNHTDTSGFGPDTPWSAFWAASAAA
jgi:RHS repeat-associated protein